MAELPFGGIGRPVLALLSALGRRASWVLVIGVALGLALPQIGAVLRPALPALVVLLFAFALIRLDGPAFAAAVRRPWGIAGVVAVLMVAVPVFVHAAASALALPADLTASLVLMACAPPIASAPNLAFLLGLDAVVAFNVVVLATLAMPLIAPPLVFAILGLDLDVAPATVALRLVTAIALGILLAALFRRLLGRDRIARHRVALDGASAVILVVFVFAVMEGVQARLIDEPMTVFLFAAAACLANFGLQAVFAGIAALFCRPAAGPRRRRALAVALMAGNRNIALFLAALPPEAVGFLTLFVAVYQIPMYATPLLAGRLYRRLIGGTPTK